jgi:TetR/AcrR family fatty acid metabolism transcriptional regulator
MIIDEAIKIIHAQGYEAFSIRELAKRVKISEPAIYRHFLNKEDIILGILNRMLDFDHLLETQILASKTAQNKLKHFIQFHFDFLENNLEMASILFDEDIFNRSKVLRKRLLSIIHKRKTLLTAIIEEGKSSKEIIDVNTQDLLAIIFGMIRMIILEWRLSNFGFSLSQRGKSAIKSLDELIFNKQKN